MYNLLESFFTPSQTVTLIIVAVAGVLLIALNIVLAYVFHKRGERKLYDLMLQKQKELLMQQLDDLRSGAVVPDEEKFRKEFFNRIPPDYIPAEHAEPAEVIAEQPSEPEEAPDEPAEEQSEELALAEAAYDDENAEIIEEVIVNGVVMRYNRSFTARIIQADDVLKARYSELKNYLLSFKGVKNRISWKKESFRTGRNTFACFTVRGKTLCLCLALDPARYADTKYKVVDLSVRSPKSKQPCLYRISTDRRVRYAKELIDTLMAELGLTQNADYAAEQFTPDYKASELLIAEGLIKVTGDVPSAATEPVNVAEQIAAVQPDELPEPPAEPVFGPEEEPEEEAAVTEAVDDDENAEIVEEEVVNGVVIRYNRSYTARITQSDDILKVRYSELKNYILSYKGVRNRISWKRETFRLGRNIFACFTVRGKTLCLCLALAPTQFEGTKYKVVDLSVRSPKSKQPCLYRISSDRRVKYAKELIDMLMSEYGVQLPLELASENYVLPYRTTEELIKTGLIRLSGDKVAAFGEEAPAATEQGLEQLPSEEPTAEEAAPVEVFAEPVAEEQSQPVAQVVEELPERDFEILEEVAVAEADIMSDEAAELLVEDKIVAKRKPAARRKCIVNIASLSAHFEAGEKVTIDVLREKKLIPGDANYIKVLAKGTLNKPLIVEADDFSLQSVKMIVLTGGRAIRRKFNEQ